MIIKATFHAVPPARVRPPPATLLPLMLRSARIPSAARPAGALARGAETPRALGRHSPAVPTRSGSATWPAASRRRAAAQRRPVKAHRCPLAFSGLQKHRSPWPVLAWAFAPHASGMPISLGITPAVSCSAGIFAKLPTSAWDNPPRPNSDQRGLGQKTPD